MEKYIVTADTYCGGYGTEITLFGIFDTENEALKFIMDNPVVKYKGLYSDEDSFDFFRFYEKCKTEKIYAECEPLKSRRYVGERTLSKEEYALKHYIQKFNGTALYLGGYAE